MQLTSKYNKTNPAGDLSVLLNKPEEGTDFFSLVMSPNEWREIYALAKFAQIGVAYDVTAPYIAQVFTYKHTDAEKLQADPDLNAAFLALDTLAAAKENTIRLSLPKEQMRQLMIVLSFAARSQRQAERLHEALPDEFPHVFPALAVASKYYAESFERLIFAVHGDESLTISPTAPEPQHG